MKRIEWILFAVLVGNTLGGYSQEKTKQEKRSKKRQNKTVYPKFGILPEK